MLQEKEINNQFGIPKDSGHTLVEEKKYNASFMETLLLGDPEKNKAKTEGRKADAEFTKALAQLTQQMALDANKKKAESNTTTIFVVGGIILAATFAGVAFYLHKKNAAE
jgi:hypothetical protein